MNDTMGNKVEQILQYRSCSAIKGQVVADFIAKFTNMEGQGVEEYPQWSIHTDGSSNKQAGGAGINMASYMPMSAVFLE